MSINGAELAECRRELEQVRCRLVEHSDNTGIKGSNFCQWAWAERNERFVCLSRSDQGVFVELWQGDVDTDIFVPTYDAGIQLAIDWLRGG